MLASGPLGPPLAEIARGPVRVAVPLHGSGSGVIPPDDDPPVHGPALDKAVITLATRCHRRVAAPRSGGQDAATMAPSSVPPIRGCVARAMGARDTRGACARTFAIDRSATVGRW